MVSLSGRTLGRRLGLVVLAIGGCGDCVGGVVAGGVVGEDLDDAALVARHGGGQRAAVAGDHVEGVAEWGSTGRAVAAALGHTSFAMTTKRHYVAEGTSERMAQRRVGSMLDPWHKSEDGEAAHAVVHDVAAVAGQQRSTAATTPAVTVTRRPGRPVFRVIEGGAGCVAGNREATSEEA